MKRFFIIGYMICSVLYTAQLSAQQKNLTVVELFTSQGCYSCPPADRLLGELKQRENMIVVACHVTYWNYLGWRDTFSQLFCDTRQRRYQQYLQGRAGVYTPQMIINGRYGVAGSRKHQVERTLDRAQALTPPMRVTLTYTAQQQTLHITLPELDKTEAHELLLLGVSDQQRLPINSGENGGKTLDYFSPIIEITPLGQWRGEAKEINHQSQFSPAIKEWVLIAQSQANGAINAAGSIAQINVKPFTNALSQ